MKWLALGAVSALAIAGCVAQDGSESSVNDVGGADVAMDPVAGEVSVKLTVDKAIVGPSERVTVKMTLTNNSDHAVRILSLYAPASELEENLFSVTREIEGAEFIGPHYKRPSPVSDDFVTLAAGASVTRDVDISELYDFSKSSDYKIKYDFTFARDGAKDTVTLSSNEISVWVEGRKYSRRDQITAESSVVAGAVTFSKCDASQTTSVNAGLAAASTMANGAVSYLNGTASGTPRYTTWFGTFSSGDWNTAKAHFGSIKDAIDTKPLTFDCSCRKKYYAYVYPNQPYKVYLCSVFWSAPTSGTDSKGGTIVHELSHFDVVAGTDDWAYGQSAAKSLAITDPAKALNNADNHEYFAENTPVLQ